MKILFREMTLRRSYKKRTFQKSKLYRRPFNGESSMEINPLESLLRNFSCFFFFQKIKTSERTSMKRSSVKGPWKIFGKGNLLREF